MTSFKSRAQLMNFTTFLELFFDERFIVDITKLKIRVLKIRELVFNVSCNCTDKRDFGCILGKSDTLFWSTDKASRHFGNIIIVDPVGKVRSI